MRNSVRLARIYGIEIGIHYSWLIVFALITWSLAGEYFPAAHPEFRYLQTAQQLGLLAGSD